MFTVQCGGRVLMRKRLEPRPFRFGNGVCRPVARCAILRRGLIDEHCLGRDNFCQFVTFCATHVLVRAPQWECGSFLVIEKRGLPFHAVVALCTARDVSYRELLSMNVFVAVFALRRCGLEIHVHQLCFQIRRLVAVDAGGGTVRP